MANTREIYCLGCKAKKKFEFEKGSGGTKKGKYIKTKAPNGRSMVKGTCGTCGRKVTSFVSS